jgi:hypothetical protein
VPEYVCQRDGIEHAISICQRVIGDHIDNAVGRLLVESVAPLALEVTLSVQQELQARVEEVDKLRKKQVERARYEADMAQRRYLHVDPANRLVADSLEADWNEKLRALTQAQEQYEQQRRQDRAVIDNQHRACINALASDFPRLWQDPKTPDRERKRMVRLLLADVTLMRGSGITVHVRFNGGATKTLELPRPLTAWELRTTPAEVVAEIDRLTEKGLLTLEEMSARLDIGPKCVITWRNHGRLHGYPVNDRDDWLYEDPGTNPPRKAQGVRLAKRRLLPQNVIRGS